MTDDADEPTIPRAALNKLIKDNAPHIRVANETRDLLHACCLEFVKYVGAEANKICAQEQRKTISHEHAYKALETLGFGRAYQEAALSVLDECKEAAQKRLKRQNSRLEKCGIPEDELLKQQQELFEKARIEQAEVEQAQMAWFQKQVESAQQLQRQENGTSANKVDSTLPANCATAAASSLSATNQVTVIAGGQSSASCQNVSVIVEPNKPSVPYSTSAKPQNSGSNRFDLDEDYDAPD